MSRRLSTIAKWINDNVPELTATLESSWSNTDRKIPGTRLRHPGKGRKGHRLVVCRHGAEVFRHDSSQTYRSNDETEDWLRRYLESDPEHLAVVASTVSRAPKRAVADTWARLRALDLLRTDTETYKWKWKRKALLRLINKIEGNDDEED